jgi:hypothetical protein
MTDATDPRWAILSDRPWICSGCGVSHQGVFDLACAAPDAWSGSRELAPNSEALNSSHFLSEDFCVLNGQHFFVRCVLELPLVGGSGARFGYGVWSTLSEKNFKLYVDRFDTGDYDGLGPWFGWFSNRLKGYPDTFNMKCQVRPQSGRQRPFIELEPIEHPLVAEQRDGVTFDRLREIYSGYGHWFGAD